ncbi:hypothetical protein Tco_0323723 [Tanacetum coccineum]
MFRIEISNPQLLKKLGSVFWRFFLRVLFVASLSRCLVSGRSRQWDSLQSLRASRLRAFVPRLSTAYLSIHRSQSSQLGPLHVCLVTSVVLLCFWLSYRLFCHLLNSHYAHAVITCGFVTDPGALGEDSLSSCPSRVMGNSLAHAVTMSIAALFYVRLSCVQAASDLLPTVCSRWLFACVCLCCVCLAHLNLAHILCTVSRLMHASVRVTVSRSFALSESIVREDLSSITALCSLRYVVVFAELSLYNQWLRTFCHEIVVSGGMSMPQLLTTSDSGLSRAAELTCVVPDAYTYPPLPRVPLSYQASACSLSTLHFLKFPENSFEVLKLLENSVEVLKILGNKLESMRILKNKLESLKLQENQPLDGLMESSATREYPVLVGFCRDMRSWTLFAMASSGGTFPVLVGFCQDMAWSFRPHLHAHTPLMSLSSKRERSGSDGCGDDEPRDDEDGGEDGEDEDDS